VNKHLHIYLSQLTLTFSWWTGQCCSLK